MKSFPSESNAKNPFLRQWRCQKGGPSVSSALLIWTLDLVLVTWMVNRKRLIVIVLLSEIWKREMYKKIMLTFFPLKVTCVKNYSLYQTLFVPMLFSMKLFDICLLKINETCYSDGSILICKIWTCIKWTEFPKLG